MSFLENVDRKKLQQILLIALASLVVIALALILVIIIASVDKDISDGFSSAELVEYTVTDKDYKTGSLVLADSDHPYSVEATMLNLVNCKEFRNSQSDATGVDTQDYHDKNYIPWQAMSFSKDAMVAAHKMLTAARDNVNPNEPVTIDAAYDTVKHGEVSPEYATAQLMLLSDMTSSASTRVPLSEEYRAWFDKNAAKYGFIESFEDAYRFVDVPHAKYMTDEDLSLAEYIEYLKENTSADQVLTVKASGEEYAIYYVDCNVGDKIEVPEDADFTVSGTNEGGVVVTVILE